MESGVCGTPNQKVAGSVGPNGEPDGPYEGMFCSYFESQAECNRGWLTHACIWRTS